MFDFDRINKVIVFLRGDMALTFCINYYYLKWCTTKNNMSTNL